MPEERRMPANDLRAMTEAEGLEAYAARQMWGTVRWEYIEDGEFRSGTTPPEAAWEGHKDEALAAARVHRRIAEDIERAVGKLDGVFDEADEASGDPNLSSERRACLYAIRTGIGDATHKL